MQTILSKEQVINPIPKYKRNQRKFQMGFKKYLGKCNTRKNNSPKNKESRLKVNNNPRITIPELQM